MQDQVNEKSVALSIKGVKLTGRLLAKAMQAFLCKMREPSKEKPGKQSLKSLTRGGASLSNIEISGDNIGSFNRIARKHNIGINLQRDNSEKTPKWIVRFKAKNADAMTAAFSEYSKAILKKKEKPSLLTRLEKFKKLAKSLASPVKNRNRGERDI